MTFRDNAPPRSEMKTSPGTRCVFCNNRLQPSPNNIKTRLRVDWGVMSRMACVVCQDDGEILT